MLTIDMMVACHWRDALPMADHLVSPTASFELADSLAAYDSCDRNAARRSPTVLRPDLDPRVADLLEIAPGWDEPLGLAGLLAGLTARGNAVAGLARRAAWKSLAEASGLEPGRLPTRDELEAISTGRCARSGAPTVSRSLSRQVLALYGALRQSAPSAEALDNMAAGRRADGTPGNTRAIVAELSRSRGSQSSVLHLTFNAAKSVSVAFALRDGPERAILLHAHRQAVRDTMVAVEGLVAQVRRGDGGAIVLPASVLWFQLTHFTSRPTEAGGLRIAGDPHLHDHVVVVCAAVAEDGRPGKIDLARLHGLIAYLSAVFHFHTAKWLRRAGVTVSLHPQADCLRLDAVPHVLERLFSKRINDGVVKTEIFADRHGFHIADLSHRQRAALLKRAVQGDPRAARRDDVANLASWHGQAEAIEARVPALLQPGLASIDVLHDPTMRAKEAAERRLAAAIAVPRAMTAITAATLGGIEAGIDDPHELPRIAAGLDDSKAPRRFDPLAQRRTASALDAADVRRRARDGSARLVGGGRGHVVAEAARLWIARRSSHGIAPPVQVASEEDLAAIEVEARRRCLDAGMLGPQTRQIIVATPEGGRRPIEIATGDAITFTAIVNGRTGSRPGRVGSAGSPATILAMDDGGMAVRTMSGDAVVSWRALYDPATESMSLRFGYASARPCRTGPGGVAVILEGSKATCRLGLSDATVLFDEELEREHLEGTRRRTGEREASVDELWDAIACNVSLRRRPATHEQLDAVRDMAKMGRLRASFLVGDRSVGSRGLRATFRATAVERATALARAVADRSISFERFVDATRCDSVGNDHAAEGGNGMRSHTSGMLGVVPPPKHADADTAELKSLVGVLDGRAGLASPAQAQARVTTGPVDDRSMRDPLHKDAVRPLPAIGLRTQPSKHPRAATGSHVERTSKPSVEKNVGSGIISETEDGCGSATEAALAVTPSTVAVGRLRSLARRLRRIPLRDHFIRLADRVDALVSETRRMIEAKRVVTGVVSKAADKRPVRHPSATSTNSGDPRVEDAGARPHERGPEPPAKGEGRVGTPQEASGMLLRGADESATGIGVMMSDVVRKTPIRKRSRRSSGKPALRKPSGHGR